MNYEDLKVWSWARAADEQKLYRIEPKNAKKQLVLAS